MQAQGQCLSHVLDGSLQGPCPPRPWPLWGSGALQSLASALAHWHPVGPGAPHCMGHSAALQSGSPLERTGFLLSGSLQLSPGSREVPEASRSPPSASTWPGGKNQREGDAGRDGGGWGARENWW